MLLYHKSPAQVIDKVGFVQTGTASYYPDDRKGVITRSGEKYDMHALTAAHQYIPFNYLVRITNLENGKQALLRINDRPYTNTRIMDMSYGAAKRLGMLGKTHTRIRLEIISKGKEPAKPALPRSKPQADTGSFAAPGIYTLQGQSIQPAGYGVQIGSFSLLDKALERGRQHHQVQQPFFIQAQWHGTQTIYKVMVGNFSGRKDAQATKEYFREKQIDAFIKPYQLSK
ncbi:septal ring lytic transglycosylase RlpA family protein [Rapidithrix thailandica]|uniref:Probable endolytic peptidoglycan transglycosylase RlpA n=1 Tax=Rapidithrix thailandica TaxID=413964 RepID=A0AAW9S554_9BACT